MKINKTSYEKLINEDIDWLLNNTERDLERDHIVTVLKDSITRIYDSNPYQKPCIYPNNFGDYLVVIDEKGFGRRCAFRQFIPFDNLPDVFGDNKQQGWILGENEKLIYWMEIPDWC